MTFDEDHHRLGIVQLPPPAQRNYRTDSLNLLHAAIHKHGLCTLTPSAAHRSGPADTLCRTAGCVVAAAAVALLAVGGQANPSLAALTTTPPLSVASVQPAPGELVGVAPPIVIMFTHRVADRAAAERALTITASPRPSGQVE